MLQFHNRICFFLLKTQRNNYSLVRNWWGNTKSSFKENAGTFSINSTTQENIKVLRLKKDSKSYIKKKTSNQKLNQ